MTTTSNIIRVIKEGQAQLQVPPTVFYNPVQEFNRDLSVLVLRTYLKYNLWHHKKQQKHILARGGIRILDALSASGLRSIRFAKELGDSGNVVSQIVANDLSETAVELIRKNVELNNVQDKVVCSHSDALQVINTSACDWDSRFHVIDLDPFGTGAKFFDAAVRSIGEAGLLMVTCTDAAVLCGNASESCFARYGSMSIRGDFCHDSALRIILRSLEQHASVYGRFIKPLLSISADFYVRVFLQVFTQQAETKRSASKLCQVFLCKECKTHELNRLGEYEMKKDEQQACSENLAVKFKFKPAEFTVSDKCQICGGKFTLGGPLWADAIHDNEFLALLKKELNLESTVKEFNTFKRIEGIVHMCDEELPVPLFYSLVQISSILKIPCPTNKDIMSALVNAGYKVSLSHTNQVGLKTDAPNTVVWDIFCQLAKQRLGGDLSDKYCETTLIGRIVRRARMERYDFTYNPAIEKESQKQSLLRFPMNPNKNWGPKSRPLSEHADKLKRQNEEDENDLETCTKKVHK